MRVSRRENGNKRGSKSRMVHHQLSHPAGDAEEVDVVGHQVVVEPEVEEVKRPSRKKERRLLQLRHQKPHEEHTRFYELTVNPLRCLNYWNCVLFTEVKYRMIESSIPGPLNISLDQLARFRRVFRSGHVFYFLF